VTKAVGFFKHYQLAWHFYKVHKHGPFASWFCLRLLYIKPYNDISFICFPFFNQPGYFKVLFKER
jgi:hypothetical protein